MTKTNKLFFTLKVPRKSSKIMKSISGVVYDLPIPKNLTVMWTFGSMLGLILVSQLVTGYLLSFHYVADSATAFSRVIHIERNVQNGWLIRSLHANGASFMMAAMYIHVARGVYFESYLSLTKTWLSGCVMLVLVMGICFLGYVLPWGQMSYWGATVITSMLGVIPLIGSNLMEAAWGGFTVGGATLSRFYSLHFSLPFLLLPLVGLHLYHLHELGSSNPLGVDSSGDSVPFHPYGTWMDLQSWSLLVGAMLVVVLVFPHALSDPANFQPADPLKTPAHIKPEWYFLPFYAILRSIPHKTAGISTMVLSLAIIFFLPFMYRQPSKREYTGFHNSWPSRESGFWGFSVNFVILGWLGACPANQPYLSLGLFHTFLFFFFFVLDASFKGKGGVVSRMA